MTPGRACFPLLRLLAAFLAGWTLTAQATTIDICVENRDVRPWRTQDGRGLNFELLDRVAHDSGVEFTFHGMPWKRCLAELKAGRVQGAMGASFKQDRLEFARYPGGNPPDAAKRLNVDRYILIRRSGSRVDWDGRQFAHLDGPVGTQPGYSVADQLRALGAEVDEGAPGAYESLQKLLTGRLPLVAMLEGEAKTLLARDPALARTVDILPRPLAEKPYFLIFSHVFVSASPRLAETIWASIETVRESPAYRQLERRSE
jgi:polar amino acid transport system substrate-binding protein